MLVTVFPFLTTAQLLGADVTPEWATRHLGVYLWPTYPRLEGYRLSELALIADYLGARVIRVPLEAHFGRETTWTELLRAPAVKDCVDPFATIILTLTDHSGRQYEPQWTRGQYETLTEYLLQTYKGSGKTFVLGLWETDHWLPLDDRGLGFLKARQEGISSAREYVGEHDVRALSMVEVTKVEGECVATKLLPKIPPEVVSLSWWASGQDVADTLRKLKTLVPSATLMVGELGLSSRRREPGRPAKLIAAIDAARAAGAEWVILWRLDDWEYGIVEGKADGGATTELWPVFWSLFHGGEPSGNPTWALSNSARREEITLVDSGQLIPLGPDVEVLAVNAQAGATDLELKGEEATIRLASSIPPQSRIEVHRDGSGVIGIGPVRAGSPDDWRPWQIEGLVWNEEFAVWQLAQRGVEGYVGMAVESDYPILGGKLWISGRKATQGDWGVRVQGYDGEWLECPEVYDWRGEQLLCQFPSSFPSEWSPVRRVELRYWIRTDDASPDWVWTTNLTSVRATLDLDFRSVSLPTDAVLSWKTDGSQPVRLTVVRRL